jgi:hypothetical protein
MMRLVKVDKGAGEASAEEAITPVDLHLGASAQLPRRDKARWRRDPRQLRHAYTVGL